MAEQLMPADHLALLAELKIRSSELKQAELSLIRPARRFIHELESAIKNQRPYSTERLVLESIAAKLGSDFFSTLLDNSPDGTSSSVSFSGTEGSTSSEDERDNYEADVCLTRKRHGVRTSLFGSDTFRNSSSSQRRHKCKFASANKHLNLLQSGESISKIRRFRFDKMELEQAIDFILSYSKLRGVDTTRLALSSDFGSFVIPWLYRVMPRDCMWNGYCSLKPDADTRIKRTSFLFLLDSLTRDEVGARTGVDYIAQEYGIDNFHAASAVVTSMWNDGFLLMRKYIVQDVVYAF
jgi:hypothetical protein